MGNCSTHPNTLIVVYFAASCVPPAAAPPKLTPDVFVQDRSGVTVVPAPGILANDDIACQNANVTLVTPPQVRLSGVDWRRGLQLHLINTAKG